MNWSLLLSAYVFVFLSALPGRTSFLMLLMATRGRARPLFWGAVIAFAIQSLISVALGNLFSFVPQSLIQFVAGLLFIYFAIHFWRESQQTLSPDTETIAANSIKSAFLVIFAAEWGDVSQVAIASFSAGHSERITVFIAALLALWSIVVLAIALGRYVGKAINSALIQKIAALGFALTGLYLTGRAAVALSMLR